MMVVKQLLLQFQQHTKANMKQGILLIATGHHYYGHLAFNLACSIRSVSELPICIVHDDTSLLDLTDKHKAVFNQFINVSDINLQTWRDARFMLPEITPYDENIALDVDMVWLQKKPEDLFSFLETTDFTCSNEGYYDITTGESNLSNIYMYWGDRDAIIKKYKLKGKFPQIRSEVMVFRKSKAVQDLFKIAKDINIKPRVDIISFSGGNPDEFSFNIALCRRKIYPHQNMWQPTCWPARERGIVPELPELYKNYYALSAGGNLISEKLKRTYDILVGAAAYKMGLTNDFPLRSKQSYQSNRSKY